MPFHSQGSYALGKIYPLKAIEMMPGDSIKVNLSSLTRSNALKYPTMANIRNEYHAFFVPARILAHNFDNFNNLAVDDASRPTLPVVNPQNYIGKITSIGYSYLKNSLLDQFDFPVFVELYDYVISSSAFQANFDRVPNPDGDDPITLNLADYYQQSSARNISFDDFNHFLANYHSLAYADLSEQKYSGETPIPAPGSAVAAQLADMVGLTSLSLLEEYTNYVMQIALSNVQGFVVTHSSDATPSAKPLNFLSLWSYWRCIYDWYINTNIDQNVDTWEAWCTSLFGCTIETMNPTLSNLNFQTFITPATRLFSSDYFTSAFLSTQNGSAVPIPSGGTLIDLRSAESEQTFREKLLFSGKRTIDQNKIFFGVTSSDARFDRAEILGSQKFMVGINSVSQTSESTSVDDPLGSYAGQGYGSGSRNGFIRYRAEEQGLIILVMSYKPETIYSGVVDRLNLKTSPFDFLKPDFENVGEQGIYQQELAYIPQIGAAGEVFGFNRRFAEYMFINSSVHGSFRSTLAFMTLARRFSGKPALNSSFIRIDPKSNGFTDMFVAPEEEEQFNNWSWFEVYCTRPLSRFIEYGF